MLSYLDAVDPDRRMTLDTLDVLLSPQSVRSARCGTRRSSPARENGGCFSWGCRGEGRRT